MNFHYASNHFSSLTNNIRQKKIVGELLSDQLYFYFKAVLNFMLLTFQTGKEAALKLAQPAWLWKLHALFKPRAYVCPQQVANGEISQFRTDQNAPCWWCSLLLEGMPDY